MGNRTDKTTQSPHEGTDVYGLDLSVWDLTPNSPSTQSTVLLNPVLTGTHLPPVPPVYGTRPEFFIQGDLYEHPLFG